ncbi:MAG: hypothetical protein ABIM62_07460 [candidate division WOR-3 bacterium]
MSQVEEKKKKKKYILIILGGLFLFFLLTILAIISIFFIGKKSVDFLRKSDKRIIKIFSSDHPEIEILEIDKKNKKIKIKNKKTGEIQILDISDMKEGKGMIEIAEKEKEGKIEIEIEGKKTETNYSKDKDLPEWLPKFKEFKILNQITTRTEKETSGVIEMESEKDIEEVAEIIEKKFMENDIKVFRTFSQVQEGKKSIMLQEFSKEKERSFFIILNEADSKTKIMINYSEKIK